MKTGFLLAGLMLIVSALVAFDVKISLNTHFDVPTAPRVFGPPSPPLPIEIAPEPTSPLKSHTPGFVDKLKAATVPLYAETKGGSIRFICTATAVQKLDKGYVFLTARHCVEDEVALFVVPDPKADAPYVKVTNGVVGGPDVDAALVMANTAVDLPVISFGTEKLVSDGSQIEYYGFPMNLGKLYFTGYISSTSLDSQEYANPQWYGDLGITIGGTFGSSGSALVDPNQEAIIGVVTGMTRNPIGGSIIMMATPASKVRRLVDYYKSGRLAFPVQPQPNRFGF